jgi:hypothetical protein
LLYRQLSGDGTHTNINAVHRHFEFDAAGQLTGMNVGPTGQTKCARMPGSW